MSGASAVTRWAAFAVEWVLLLGGISATAAALLTHNEHAGFEGLVLFGLSTILGCVRPRKGQQ